MKRLRVDEKKFIETYKSYKKEIRLLRTLLNNSHAWYKWCKKKKIDYVSDNELIKSLNMYEDNLFLLQSFIYKD